MTAMFFDDGRPMPNCPAPNIVYFCIQMAAVVTAKRGGRNMDHLAECASFMEESVGRRLSIADPLPDEYDWTPASAIECAVAMMEYDS